jgi:predicted transcriptional regulator
MYKTDKLIDAIMSHEGVVKYAAKALGITQATIYNHIRDNKKVAQALEDARELRRLKDCDEDQILVAEARKSIKTLLEKCDVTATIFVLKVKGNWIQIDNSNSEQKITIVDATAKNRKICESDH